MVVNTYGISVGIEKIGWKLYLVYIGWICVELVIIYFVSCFFLFFFSFLPRLSLSLFCSQYHYHCYEQREQQTGFPEMILMLILFFLAVLCGNSRENVGRTQADFRGAESSQGIYSQD